MRQVLRTRRVGPAAGMLMALALVPSWASPAFAEDAAVKLTADEVNALWTCLAAFLVFFMQAGFAMVEAGMTSARNTANILMKNLMDFSVGSMAFWVLGFGLMFGASGGFAGMNGFFYDPSNVLGEQTMASAKGWSEGFSWAFFLFQTAFAGTAATIVSGAMAERTKFGSYVVFSAVMTAVIYPLFGSWAWGSLYLGSGWLENMGFHDFAGSTVVHSVGGWAALAGAIVLGPRSGRYRGQQVTAMPGHSLPLASLGVFILWLGWFGFNPGSTTSVSNAAFASIAVTTNMAAAAGAFGGMALSWLWFKRPDPTFALNGALAGLVAITAGCDVFSVASALVVGLAAGFLVVVSVVLVDKIRVDDPVGAISVHGVCGAWGTLAVGLFGKDNGLLTSGSANLLMSQIVGVAAAFVWAFGVGYIVFRLLKATLGVRVDREAELTGLDLVEHGVEAYPEFQGVFTNATVDSASDADPTVAATPAMVYPTR